MVAIFIIIELEKRIFVKFTVFYRIVLIGYRLTLLQHVSITQIVPVYIKN